MTAQQELSEISSRITVITCTHGISARKELFEFFDLNRELGFRKVDECMLTNVPAEKLRGLRCSIYDLIRIGAENCTFWSQTGGKVSPKDRDAIVQMATQTKDIISIAKEILEKIPISEAGAAARDARYNVQNSINIAQKAIKTVSEMVLGVFSDKSTDKVPESVCQAADRVIDWLKPYSNKVDSDFLDRTSKKMDIFKKNILRLSKDLSAVELELDDDFVLV